MEDRDDADAGAQVLGIGRERERGFGRSWLTSGTGQGSGTAEILSGSEGSSAALTRLPQANCRPKAATPFARTQ